MRFQREPPPANKNSILSCISSVQNWSQFWGKGFGSVLLQVNSMYLELQHLGWNPGKLWRHWVYPDILCQHKDSQHSVPSPVKRCWRTLVIVEIGTAIIQYNTITKSFLIVLLLTLFSGFLLRLDLSALWRLGGMVIWALCVIVAGLLVSRGCLGRLTMALLGKFAYI